MKWLIWVVAASGLWASAGQAQWDQRRWLTNNLGLHTDVCAVVDSAFRLHVFYVRDDTLGRNQPRSLYYQRFDSWGNPLSEPLRLYTVNRLYATQGRPAILIDRQQQLHVVWGVTAYEMPYEFLYTRLSLDGRILSEPRLVRPPGWPQYWAGDGVQLVETSDRVLWMVHFGLVWAFDEQGNDVVPMHRYVPDGTEAVYARLAVGPGDQVWSCMRYIGPPEIGQCLAVTRLDSGDGTPEVLWPQGGTRDLGLTGFQIDGSGAFHVISYRDDLGIFYIRDGRTGAPVESMGIDSNPNAVGCSDLIWVADTLQFLWYRLEGIMHVSFNTAGQRIHGPVLTRTVVGLDAYLWQQGSYWLIGGTQGPRPDRAQVGMIHVPGPHEPPDAVDERQPRAARPAIQAFPNPVQSSCYLQLPATYGPGLPQSVRLFNILGQTLMQLPVAASSGGTRLRLELPPSLPAGQYLLQLDLPSESPIIPILHLP